MITDKGLEAMRRMGGVMEERREKINDFVSENLPKGPDGFVNRLAGLLLFADPSEPAGPLLRKIDQMIVEYWEDSGGSQDN